MNSSNSPARFGGAKSAKAETVEGYFLNILENGKWQTVEKFSATDRDAAIAAARESLENPSVQSVKVTANSHDDRSGTVSEKVIFLDDQRVAQNKSNSWQESPNANGNFQGAESLNSPFSTGVRAGVLAPKGNLRRGAGGIRMPKFLLFGEQGEASTEAQNNAAKVGVRPSSMLPKNSWLSAILAMVAGVSMALLFGFFPNVTALVMNLLGPEALPLLAIFAFLSGAGFIALFIQSTRREYRPTQLAPTSTGFTRSEQIKNIKTLFPDAADRQGDSQFDGNESVRRQMRDSDPQASADQKLGLYRSQAAMTLTNSYSSKIIKDSIARDSGKKDLNSEVELILPGFNFDIKNRELNLILTELLRHPEIMTHQPLRSGSSGELTQTWQLIALGMIQMAFDSHPYSPEIATRILVPLVTKLGVANDQQAREEARRIAQNFERFRDDRFTRAIIRATTDLLRRRGSDPQFADRIAALMVAANAGPNPVKDSDAKQNSIAPANEMESLPGSITLMVGEFLSRQVRGRDSVVANFEMQQQLDLIMNETMARFMGRLIPYRQGRVLGVFAMAENGFGAAVSLIQNLQQLTETSNLELPKIKIGLSSSATTGLDLPTQMTDAIAAAVELCQGAPPGEVLVSPELALKFNGMPNYSFAAMPNPGSDDQTTPAAEPRAYRLTWNG